MDAQHDAKEAATLQGHVIELDKQVKQLQQQLNDARKPLAAEKEQTQGKA